MSNETQQKQGFEISAPSSQTKIHPPGWRQAEESQEQWNRVHAQLLKSVADAQAKLLAAQNETADKLTDVVVPVLASLENRLIEAHNHDAWLIGRMEAIEAKLTRPRRPVERLRTKRIVKRATPERKRGR